MLYIVGKLTCSQCYALFDTYRFDLVTVFVIFAIEISDFGATWQKGRRPAREPYLPPCKLSRRSVPPPDQPTFRSASIKVAVLTYKVLRGCAPSYLGPFVRVADLPCRRALRSANNSRLIQPQSNRSTVGDRAFPVAGPLVWNSLPPESHQRHHWTPFAGV